MKQHEAVIKVMEENGGYAALSYLYENVFKIKDVVWKTKTPFASIRRIVQDPRFFFKIKPGLWALLSYKTKLPEHILALQEKREEKEPDSNYSHTYFQGIVIQWGNILHYQTYAPPQDRNRPFQNSKLKDVVSLESIPKFGYAELVDTAKTIDAIWFNRREMPEKLFEVEHSTDIEHSLDKYLKLQDFYSQFYIVADEKRKNKYSSLIKWDMYTNIRERVYFLDYERLVKMFTNQYENHLMTQKLGFRM